jgi:hypothetical protein
MYGYYIVKLIGGMFFSWIFLFSGLGKRIDNKNNLPSFFATKLTKQDFSFQSKNPKPTKNYQIVKTNNHTNFVFKKDIPAEIHGKDCTFFDQNETEIENEIHSMRSNFWKMALLKILESPTVSEQKKIETIRREYMEIYGRPTITAINCDALFKGFEEFNFDDNDANHDFL